MADVPVHASLSALLLLLPFAWLWWRSVARRYTAEASLANVLAVGLLVFGNVLVTHVVGLITQRFYVAVTASIAGPGLLGLVFYIRGWKAPAASAPERSPRDRIYTATLLIAALAMAPAVILFDFHDLVLATGHMATTSQILNGIYPPRSMSSADRVWIYHYAVDQLFASVTALLRIRLEVAVDLTALALWLYSAHLFGLLCRFLFGRPYDSLGVLVGCFSGGLPWLASWDLPTNLGEVQAIYSYAGYWGSPPLVSNFLQYPWALGLPLMLFVLLVLGIELGRDPPDPAARRRGIAMIGLALATLSVAQVAGFLALFAALAAWTLGSLLRGPRRDRDLWLGLAALLVSVAAVLPLLGGMLGPLVTATGHDWLARAGILEAPASPLESHLRFWRPVPLLDKLRWNLASWGLFPLGLACLVTRHPPAARSLLQLMAIVFAVAFLVMNLLYYDESWDIVKFACAGSIPLAVLSVGAVKAALVSAVRAATIRRRLMFGGIAAWTALLLTAGLLHQAGVMAEAVSPPTLPVRMPALWRVSWLATALSDGDAASIAWLRRQIRAGEMVVCGQRLERACAIFGGFPQPTISTSSHLGYGKSEQQRLLLLREARTPRDYQALGVCWAIDASLSRFERNSSRVRFGARGSPEAARCSGSLPRKGTPCDAPAVVRLCPDSPKSAR